MDGTLAKRAQGQDRARGRRPLRLPDHGPERRSGRNPSQGDARHPHHRGGSGYLDASALERGQGPTAPVAGWLIADRGERRQERRRGPNLDGPPHAHLLFKVNHHCRKARLIHAMSGLLLLLALNGQIDLLLITTPLPQSFAQLDQPSDPHFAIANRAIGPFQLPADCL
ncbi:hypothetical protein CHELA41_22766 [Hyphomicrobiales bacterium]|nr:hypothetical protein CHELA41_22766 [Hyphomicrobiales bacterium]